MTIEQAMPIRSTVPARLDRLGWSPFHTRMVAGLGAAWILDGLQITISSSVTGVLISPDTLNMTSTEVGLIASVYLVGEMVGALVFGKMSDRLGRKRLLITTLLLYLLGTGAARVCDRPSHGLAAVLLRDPVCRRHGHWRAVRRNQLGD
jgi:MFS family permease